MWIMRKMRHWKCEFLDKWKIFAPVWFFSGMYQRESTRIWGKSARSNEAWRAYITAFQSWDKLRLMSYQHHQVLDCHRGTTWALSWAGNPWLCRLIEEFRQLERPRVGLISSFWEALKKTGTRWFFLRLWVSQMHNQVFPLRESPIAFRDWPWYTINLLIGLLRTLSTTEYTKKGKETQ